MRDGEVDVRNSQFRIGYNGGFVKPDLLICSPVYTRDPRGRKQSLCGFGMSVSQMTPNDGPLRRAGCFQTALHKID
ncbi:hypothetical protein HGG75_27670 [Ochrobactrum pseudogrignonense]|nr:hypothetical protein [Brucella pseudogrignonensis]